MFVYFIAGCFFGLVVMALFMYARLMKSRNELMTLKKMNDNLEKLNANLQGNIYASSIATQENTPARKVANSK